jgi:lysophospholipid acyltransferase
MVLTLKVISCAINYSDGLLKEEGLRDAQKKYRLTKLPSLIEYFGYCLCCGSHFAGPVYEMKDYLEWIERKGVSDIQLFVQLCCLLPLPDSH